MPPDFQIEFFDEEPMELEPHGADVYGDRQLRGHVQNNFFDHAFLDQLFIPDTFLFHMANFKMPRKGPKLNFN